MYKKYHFILYFCCQMLSCVYCNATNNNNFTYDETFSCCNDVFGSCKSACTKLSLVQLASESVIKEYRLQNVRKYCPTIQTEFWTCFNKTLEAIAQGSHFSGRQCCALAIATRCQNGCATAASRSDLKNSCRISDELNLYSCMDHLESSQQCCSNAKTQQCMQICQDAFKSKGSSFSELKEQLYTHCQNSNPNIIECVHKSVDLIPQTNLGHYLPCCDKGHNDECQKVCKSTLIKKDYTTQEIIDLLEPSCGAVLPYDPLWQCFLAGGAKVSSPDSSNEVSRINQVGMDSAKLSCCFKSVTARCKRLCFATFTNDWDQQRGSFYDCIHQNEQEVSLRKCLAEIDEPCELGCDGLSFCKNFNNRPTELFRSCNRDGDHSAALDLKMWQEENILRLPGFDVPLTNISACEPEKWRAIACALQIKPCTQDNHFNQICREDCIEILHKCMDWTKMDVDASTICAKLSPENDDVPCISLRPYIEPSDLPYTAGNDLTVVSPCKGHPCNSSQICQVKRDGSNGHVCVNACSLGEASAYQVPVGQFVRIPASQNKGCYKICRCGESGLIEKCQPLPCVNYSACNIGGRRIDHASWFFIECNICSCFAGEQTCTKKQCRIQGAAERAFTSLPCNCPAHYVPVCGRNGNTYPSACVAKCSGLQDSEIEFGPCRSRNPCDNNDCPRDTTCIVDHNVCLSVMHKPCPQYQCVNGTSLCPISPVTDTSFKVHSSVCDLVKSKSMLAYFGMFNDNICKNSGLVCGIDGVTYKSECEALSEFSLMDYQGACQNVGTVNEDSYAKKCSQVKCAIELPDNCLGIVPPGACCPICAGVFRVVFSRKQIDRALYALRGKNTESLTLKAILKSLQNLVQVSQCYLAGFLTFETDIFVAIHSIHKKPTAIQVETCKREAEKIANLIAAKSHYFTSDLGLSALTVATLVEAPISNGETLIVNFVLILGSSLLLLVSRLNNYYSFL